MDLLRVPTYIFTNIDMLNAVTFVEVYLNKKNYLILQQHLCM